MRANQYRRAFLRLGMEKLTLMRLEHNPTHLELRERLAAIEHERWADWQKYMHSLCIRNVDGSLTISAELVQRWERQIDKRYEHLTEREKDSDREQVDRYWDLVMYWPLIADEYNDALRAEDV